MNSFEEFLQDYEKHEEENINKYISRLDQGKITQNEKYPPKDRFIKLKEPVADPYTNIWGIVPFYGSTLVKLIPKDNKQEFDVGHEWLGFNSRKIDEMIDFQKETGKIQFTLTTPPTYYKNLDFLEPLFNELKPPIIQYDSVSAVGYELDKKYKIEFETLAQHGFNYFVKCVTESFGNTNPAYTLAKLEDYSSRYSVLKANGYEELADEIGTLMIIEPEKALLYLILFGFLIANPQKSLLKPICNYNKNFMENVNEFGRSYGIEINHDIPYEIGKFLLNKIVFYPETIDGCKKIVQEHDHHELYKVLGALNKGVGKKNIDIIDDKKNNMSEILDNIWNDSNKIKRKSDGIRYAVPLSVGLIGGLAEGMPGLGIMAGLGLSACDTIWGIQSGSASEKIAKYVSPNHLVSIYDFKNKHSLEG